MTMHAVIIDDQPDYIQYVTEFLKSIGVRVTTFLSPPGDEQLAALDHADVMSIDSQFLFDDSRGEEYILEHLQQISRVAEKIVLTTAHRSAVLRATELKHKGVDIISKASDEEIEMWAKMREGTKGDNAGKLAYQKERVGEIIRDRVLYEKMRPAIDLWLDRQISKGGSPALFFGEEEVGLQDLKSLLDSGSPHAEILLEAFAKHFAAHLEDY